jgi:hypothetical protein
LAKHNSPIEKGWELWRVTDGQTIWWIAVPADRGLGDQDVIDEFLEEVETDTVVRHDSLTAVRIEDLDAPRGIYKTYRTLMDERLPEAPQGAAHIIESTEGGRLR